VGQKVLVAEGSAFRVPILVTFDTVLRALQAGLKDEVMFPGTSQRLSMENLQHLHRYSNLKQLGVGVHDLQIQMEKIEIMCLKDEQITALRSAILKFDSGDEKLAKLIEHTIPEEPDKQAKIILWVQSCEQTLKKMHALQMIEGTFAAIADMWKNEGLQKTTEQRFEELMLTETRFIEGLQALLDKMQPFFEGHKDALLKGLPTDELKPNDFRVFIKALGKMLSSHQKSFEQMGIAISSFLTHNNTEGLSKTFKDIAKNIREIYPSFMNRQDLVLNQLNRAIELNPQLGIDLKEMLKDKRFGGCGLGSTLVSPMQRAVSYQLILEAVIKTAPEGSFLVPLQLSLEEVKSATSKLDEVAAHYRNMRKLVSRVQGLDSTIVCEGQQILLESDAKLKLGPHRNKVKLVLLVDRLLVCDAEPGQLADSPRGQPGQPEDVPECCLQKALMLQKFQLSVDTDKDEGLLKVVCEGQPHHFQLLNIQELESWEEQLKDALQNLMRGSLDVTVRSQIWNKKYDAKSGQWYYWRMNDNGKYEAQWPKPNGWFEQS